MVLLETPDSPVGTPPPSFNASAVIASRLTHWTLSPLLRLLSLPDHAREPRSTPPCWKPGLPRLLLRQRLAAPGRMTLNRRRSPLTRQRRRKPSQRPTSRALRVHQFPHGPSRSARLTLSNPSSLLLHQLPHQQQHQHQQGPRGGRYALQTQALAVKVSWLSTSTTTSKLLVSRIPSRVGLTLATSSANDLG